MVGIDQEKINRQLEDLVNKASVVNKAPRKVLYRGRKLEPEPSGKHSSEEKLPFNRKKG